MSVYDKELIINGEAVRSPEQQVYKNMKDIQELKNKIQTWYACSIELSQSDNTVLRSNTNVPDDKASGLLIDPTGDMFNITGGDDTTLLIEFYASIKGPQGEPGAALNIDDSTTSLTKVWSSQKTSNSLDKGIYYTTVEPELSGAIYLLEKIYLENVSSTTNVKNKDILIYIHNGVPTKIYKITEASGDELQLSLIGTYSQGKQLYLHRIECRNTGSTGAIVVQIISDRSTVYTTADMTQFLENVTADNVSRTYPASGYVKVDGVYHYVCGVRANKSASPHETNAIYLLADGSNYAEIKITIYNGSYTPIAL